MLKVGQKVTFLSKEELQRKGKVLSDGDIAYEYKEDNYPHNLLMLSGDMMEEAYGKTVTVSSVTLEKILLSKNLFTYTFMQSGCLKKILLSRQRRIRKDKNEY